MTSIRMANGQSQTQGRTHGEAVEDLSRRYSAALQRYFGRRGIGPDDAADLAQEVFAKLSDRNALDGVDNVDGYLFAIAGNIARDHYRRRKVRLDYASAAQLEEGFGHDNFTPERLYEGQQELDAVVAALNEMPERMRNIFILARLENLPRAEIAARLGVSKRTVELQITQATACLADRRRRFT